MLPVIWDGDLHSDRRAASGMKDEARITHKPNLEDFSLSKVHNEFFPSRENQGKGEGWLFISPQENTCLCPFSTTRIFQENPKHSLRIPHQLAPSNKLSKRKFSPSLTSYAITAGDEQT